MVACVRAPTKKRHRPMKPLSSIQLWSPIQQTAARAAEPVVQRQKTRAVLISAFLHMRDQRHLHPGLVQDQCHQRGIIFHHQIAAPVTRGKGAHIDPYGVPRRKALRQRKVHPVQLEGRVSAEDHVFSDPRLQKPLIGDGLPGRNEIISPHILRYGRVLEQGGFYRAAPQDRFRAPPLEFPPVDAEDIRAAITIIVPADRETDISRTYRLEKILMREADIYGVVVAKLKMHRVPQALHRAQLPRCIRQECDDLLQTVPPVLFRRGPSPAPPGTPAS